MPVSQATQGFGFGRPGGFGPGSTSSSTVAGGTGATTRPTVSSTLRAAFQACRSDLGGAFGGGSGARFNSPADQAYRQCLQVHGVTLPTFPANGSGGVTPGSTPPGGGLSSLANNPQYQAARTACAALLPARTTTTNPGV